MARRQSERRSGRRPGASGTREAILAAAARQFAEHGFARATLRSIAAEAGVDAALVGHFFGSKRGLFAATVQPPVNPLEVLAVLTSGDRADMGRRLAGFVATALEDPATLQRATAIIRAALTEPEVAEVLRSALIAQLVAKVAKALEPPAELRATLVASQIVGLLLARHVLRLGPLADLAPQAVAEAIAPTLQRYLTGPLAAGGSAQSAPASEPPNTPR